MSETHGFYRGGDAANIHESHDTDTDGRPAGGRTTGIGFRITWQDGPLGQPPRPPNGAFVEDVIAAALGRLRFYQVCQDGAFACRENALAITKLEEALHWLDSRRRDREERGVRGTHAP